MDDKEIAELLRVKREEEANIQHFADIKTAVCNLYRRKMSNLNFEYHTDKFSRERELKSHSIMADLTGDDITETKKWFAQQEEVEVKRTNEQQRQYQSDLNRDLDIINAQAERAGVPPSKIGVAKYDSIC